MSVLLFLRDLLAVIGGIAVILMLLAACLGAKSPL